ncbi:MAG: hypothetical protein R3246_13510 [Acidimicrobiia bacterium]|nr:hypothetical protein [Acidimicrobiia bacterium]
MNETTTMHPALRILLGVAVIVAAGWGAFVAWFVGIVLYTGCFISCSEPNTLGGFGLILVAAALVGLVVAAGGFAYAGWRRELMFKLWAIGAGAGGILGVGTLIFS